MDWEFFLRKAGFALSQGDGPPVTKWPLLRTTVIVYAVAFAVLNLGIIVTRFDDTGKNRFYPFSSMNFYSNVSAQRPYSLHQFYPFTYGQLFVRYDDSTSRKWSCVPHISSSYVIAFRDNVAADKKAIQQAGAMSVVLERIREVDGKPIADCAGTGTVATAGVAAIDLYASVLHIPAYPAAVRFEVGRRALVSRYEARNGRVIVASGDLEWVNGRWQVQVASRGMNVGKYQVLLSEDPWKVGSPKLFVPPGQWQGLTFTLDPAYAKALKPG